MAWTAPTAAELKTRFPAFAAVGDVIVDLALGEAALMVDESWVSEADFKLGRLLLAAHILTLDGHGTGAEAELGAAGALGFKSMRSGQLSLDRGESADAGAGGAGMYGVTSYGRRFLELLKRNQPAVLVV